MSNSLFAFCEDSFCALGTTVVIIYYDANQGKLISYIYAPGLSSAPKSCASIESFIKAAVIEIIGS